jgi:hypothetical protein
MKRLNMVSLRKRSGSLFIKEPAEVRFWRAVDVRGKDQCWEWMGALHYKGYGEFAPIAKHKTKSHRFAWESKNGPIPDGKMVCHKCDNRPCCNPSHLFLGNAKTNMDDCTNKMRHCHGEKSPKAKLTESDVIAIRNADKTKRTRLSIAKEFGISGRQVTSVCRYESWKHIR